MQTSSGEQAAGPGGTPPANPMAMCPMAKMCEGMVQKPRPGLFLMLPGLLLIVLGALIFIEPRIVVWLVGGVLVLMGIMFFMMARFVGRSRKASF